MILQFNKRKINNYLIKLSNCMNEEAVSISIKKLYNSDFITKDYWVIFNDYLGGLYDIKV